MQIVLSLLGLLLFVGAPCGLAVWLGTRVRQPVAAFFLAWFVTPVIVTVGSVLLAPWAPRGNDGTWVIMFPLMGIGTGLLSGIVAAVLVDRRTVAESTAADHSNSGASEPAKRD